MTRITILWLALLLFVATHFLAAQTSWEKISAEPGFHIQFSSASGTFTGLKANGIMLSRSTDSGITWNSLNLPPWRYNGIAMASPSVAWVGFNNTPNDAEGGVILTVDNWATWEALHFTEMAHGGMT